MTRERTSDLSGIIRIIEVIDFVHIISIGQIVRRRVPVNGCTTFPSSNNARSQQFTPLSGSQTFVGDGIVGQELVELWNELSQFPEREERAIFGPGGTASIALFADENYASICSNLACVGLPEADDWRL